MIKDFKKIAIIAGQREVSYTELLSNIDAYARHTSYAERSRVIIFSENREEWIYTFFSVWNNRSIAVPVDASSTVSDLAYIVNDCRPAFIWASTNTVGTVRKALEQTGLEIAIGIIDADVTSSPLAQHAIPTVKAPSATEWLSGREVAVIIYTSGTTGSPKGVMLSYDNLYANMRGVCEEVKIFSPHRRTMILLPVHHILPLMGTVIIPILMGGGVALCPSLSGPDIMDTLCRGKVAIFIGVPRLWQTLYTGIKKKIDASPVTRTLFNICEKAQSRTLSRFVFQSIRKKMGGHIDFCVSGGAALDPEIGRGLRTLGLDVLEGYGMSETAPIISFTRPGDIIPGCSGLPLPSVECKLVNGELCAKGPNVMLGYYNRPEETAAVIDKDGFIHTGDLARIDEKGRVYITGRTKEIIVLSNGKNVQPAEIEFQIEKFDNYIKECAVTEKDDMLLSIIVPQDSWAAGKTDEELAEILKREVIEPYNTTVENYKKVMRIHVFHGDLPRTKLDKLQRFKLKDLINAPKPLQQNEQDDALDENQTEEYLILKKYIEQEKKLPVTPLSHIETDLAFDSLDKVSLQGFIEDTFGTMVNADEMASYANIGAMAEHISDAKTRVDIGDTDWHSILTGSNVDDAPLPSTSATYPLLSRLSKVYFKLHNRLKIEGADNIPEEGPFIIAPNHQSFLDGPLSMAGVPWKQISDCYFYATEKHVKHPVARYLAKHNNVILMERRNLKTSILKLAKVLRQDKVICIFPEGSRTHTGAMGRYHKTFAILSKELNVPIVPVCIDGAFESLPRSKRFPNCHKIRITYLPAIHPANTENYDELTERVRRVTETQLIKDKK